MASSMKNIRTKKESKFYADDSSNIQESEDQKPMEDKFYKEAAREILRDAVKERQTKEAPETATIEESRPAIQQTPAIQNPHVPSVQASNAQPDQKQETNAQEEVTVQPSAYPQTESSEFGASEFDDFDFVEAYDDDPVSQDDQMLPENRAPSAINCAFLGVGGGGGKLAKAFLDLGYTKTLLVNTTVKDQPEGVPSEHFLLLPGADGVGKDIALGKKVLSDNSASVEDALRTRIGKVDWLFVMAGGGGGTGSACGALHLSLERYLKSVGAGGKVVYVITKPSSQELLNPTISTNYESLSADVALQPHILLDNEKQLQLLRGKVGMLGMYPTANKNFAKLVMQVLKLANENSPIQSFDSKDLERVLGTSGRMVIGSTVARDVSKQDIGAMLYQGCLKSSPCPSPAGKASTGVMLLIVTPEMGSDPAVSKKLEAAFSYVGGRTDTLFSGVYVKQPLPGLIAISVIGGF
jgi:cell division GTPase FtsZ